MNFTKRLHKTHSPSNNTMRRSFDSRTNKIIRFLAHSTRENIEARFIDNNRLFAAHVNDVLDLGPQQANPGFAVRDLRRLVCEGYGYLPRA